MKKNKAKAAIYIKILLTFFITYLVLMSGFSMVLIVQQKKVESLKLGSYALQVSNTVDDILKDNLDNNNQITNISKVKMELTKEIGSFTYQGTEMAVFSNDFNLLFHTRHEWLCCYGEDNNYMKYGYLNPLDWFTKEETTEIINYQISNPKAVKAGDITGYYIQIDSFWVDGEKIIPEKISVAALYAESFDKNGNLLTSYAAHTNQKIYSTDYEDTGELPYYRNGYIQNYNLSTNNEKQIQLQQLAQNPEKLKATVDTFDSFQDERVKFLTYRFYIPKAYLNTVEIKSNQNVYTPYWTVVVREVNLLEQCATTLVFMWVSCLVAFGIAAVLLADQTYKTNRKRDSLEMQRMDMTNAMAHDLKTPLSIISGYAQNLQENVHTEKRDYYAGNIQENVKRMDKIIQDMLELSRLESDALEKKFKKESLGDICEEVISRYTLLCTEKSIKMYLEGDAKLFMDSSLIERVIDNFIVNALDYTPDGGRIQIKIKEHLLECYNSGSHIPEEMLNKIWLPYQKADDSRSHTKGTGLGLSISRAILDLHHYSYGAENREDGVVFWFRFISKYQIINKKSN